MRKYVLIAASLILLALLVACGGGGDDTQYVEYGTGDLNGEWNFQSGNPLTDNGTLTFDSKGNLIGVTPPAGSSDVILEFGGQLSVYKPSTVSGSLTITSLVTAEDGTQQTVTQDLSLSGNFVASSYISGLIVNEAVENPQSVGFSLTKN